MASVQVELPESVLAALRKAPHEVGPEMLLPQQFIGISRA